MPGRRDRPPRDRSDPDECRNCGGTAFTWGLPYSRGRAIGFLPGATAVERFFQLGAQRLAARRCDGCGHVELFVRSPEP